MLVEVKKLQVHYENKEALKRIDLEAEEGSMVCLLGANGAGKTTFLKTLAGLLKPTSGQIVFKGVPIERRPCEEIVKAGIALVPEGRRVFPYMTALDNLMMGSFTRKKDGEAITRDLDRVFAYFPILRERSRQKAGTLSGGEQQMLAIGRALMAAPSLLALDEPSLGIAPLVIAEIGKLLGKLHEEEGITILLVEQNVRLGLSLASKVYLLELGNIVLQGAPKEIEGNDYIQRAYLGA